MIDRDRLRVALAALRVDQMTDEDREVVVRAVAERDTEAVEALIGWALDRITRERRDGR